MFEQAKDVTYIVDNSVKIYDFSWNWNMPVVRLLRPVMVYAILLQCRDYTTIDKDKTLNAESMLLYVRESE